MKNNARPLAVPIVSALLLLVPLYVFADENLRYAVGLSDISAKFPSIPAKKTKRDENMETETLISSVDRDSGWVMHAIVEAKSLHGQPLIELNSESAARYAQGISTNPSINATVVDPGTVYHKDGRAQLDFKLSVTYEGQRGEGLYWTSVYHGITYQASTWCFGDALKNCASEHNNFMNTVKY